MYLVLSCCNIFIHKCYASLKAPWCTTNTSWLDYNKKIRLQNKNKQKWRHRQLIDFNLTSYRYRYLMPSPQETRGMSTRIKTEICIFLEMIVCEMICEMSLSVSHYVTLLWVSWQERNECLLSRFTCHITSGHDIQIDQIIFWFLVVEKERNSLLFTLYININHDIVILLG